MKLVHCLYHSNVLYINEAHFQTHIFKQITCVNRTFHKYCKSLIPMDIERCFEIFSNANSNETLKHTGNKMMQKIFSLLNASRGFIIFCSKKVKKNYKSISSFSLKPTIINPNASSAHTSVHFRHVFLYSEIRNSYRKFSKNIFLSL